MSNARLPLRRQSVSACSRSSPRSLSVTVRDAGENGSGASYLPRFTREIFLAHRFNDLGYAEIAVMTGASVHQVEREVACALAAIDR
jgi:hypothetical protein